MRTVTSRTSFLKKFTKFQILQGSRRCVGIFAGSERADCRSSFGREQLLARQMPDRGSRALRPL